MNAVGRKTRDQHQRDGDERAADLVHGLVSGLARRQALAQIALDVLDDDDRVIDDDADREHETEQRQSVERDPHRRHDGERADQRHGDGDDRNDRGAPRLQEQDDDHDDEQHRLEQRPHHGIDRRLDEVGRIVDHRIADARREVLGQSAHLGLDGPSRRQRVRARPLKDDEGGRHLVIEVSVDRVVLRPELDARDIAHAHDRPVGAGLDDDVLELVGRRQPAQRLHRELEAAWRGRRRLVDGAGGNLQVRGAQRCDDLARGETDGRDLRRVEPYAHRIVARTENVDVAHAVDAEQHVLHVQRSRSWKCTAGRGSHPARSCARPS